jgi:hypothetical protein
MEEYTKRQKAVSEVSALINRNHRALATYKSQIAQIQSKGVVEEVERVVEELSNDVDTMESGELDPDILLEKIDACTARIDAKFITDDTVMTREIADRLIEFLKKKVRLNSAPFYCPYAWIRQPLLACLYWKSDSHLVSRRMVGSSAHAATSPLQAMTKRRYSKLG